MAWWVGYGEKVRFAKAYRTLGIPSPQHPIHAQQRRHIHCMTDRIQRTRIPGAHLLAVLHQALMEGIQFVFDMGNVGSVGHP